MKMSRLSYELKKSDFGDNLLDDSLVLILICTWVPTPEDYYEILIEQMCIEQIYLELLMETKDEKQI